MKPWDLEPAHDLDLPLRERLKSARRESGLIETVARASWWRGVRAYLRLRHDFKIEGGEHLPQSAPFVMVANHSSHLDALCLAAPIAPHLRDRTFPIAAGDTFFESDMSAAFAVGLLNALPLWRRRTGAGALEALRERLLHEPCGYILFPEGTRTRTGEMGAFKAGLGMMVAQTGVPVVPCYLHGTFAAWPPDAKKPRRGPVSLRVGAPLRFDSVANERAGWEQIAQETEAAVRRLNA